MNATRSLPLQTRLAAIRRLTPESGVNDVADRYEVTWSTGAQVRRFDWWEGEEFMEELDLSGADLTRLNAGAPVLDSHQSYGLSHVIGVVERAWVDGDAAKAEIRLSDRPEVAGIRQDVASGILRNLSVGYAISEIEHIKSSERGMPDLVRVTRFEPLELSIVPVPADHGAQFKRDGTAAAFPVTIRSAEETPMPEIDQDTGAETPEIETVAEVTAPAEDAVDSVTEAVTAERSRCASILTLARTHKMGDKAGGWIADGLSVDAVRAAILDQLAAADQSTAIRSGTRGEAPSTPDLSALQRSLLNQVANRG